MPRHQKCFQQRAFTLIEAVIAMGLLAVIAVSVYSSFQGGFLAYRRIESGLGSDHEFDMFARQITQELRNSFEYAPIPFQGKSDLIRFPSRLWRYDKNNFDEAFYEVSYRFRNGKLERIEKKLRRSFSESGSEAEELFALESCRFEYAYEKNNTIEWKNEWTDTPYLGLPRGIRLIVKIRNPNRKEIEQTIDILIPHGILGSVR